MLQSPSNFFNTKKYANYIAAKPHGMTFPIIFLLSRLNANWWLSWHLFYKIKRLPKNFSWLWLSELLWVFFLFSVDKDSSFLFSIEDFTITVSFFKKSLYPWSSSGLQMISCPVKKGTLQMMHYFTL